MSRSLLVKRCGLLAWRKTSRAKAPSPCWRLQTKCLQTLPHGTIESLLKPENKSELQAILKCHVLNQPQSARDIRRWSGVRSLQGTLIDVASTHPLTLKKSKVVTPDIDCANGVIHVLDNVLVPNEASEIPFDQASEFRLLQRLDPKMEAHLKSVDGGDTTSVTICKLSSKPTLVHRIDFEGFEGFERSVESLLHPRVSKSVRAGTPDTYGF